MDPILAEPYEARAVRFLGLWKHAGWRLKLYGLAYRRALPQAELITAARERAHAALPEPPVTAGRYGVGFLGVHEGRGANLVFVDWWENGNELQHRVFVAGPERPLDLRDATVGGPTACVWDLAVVEFERRAWISNVLLDPTRASLDAYLECRFEGWI